MLEKVYVENFKSFEKAEIPLNKINVLCGRTGSGKSNFISLLKMIKSAIDNYHYFNKENRLIYCDKSIYILLQLSEEASFPFKNWDFYNFNRVNKNRTLETLKYLRYLQENKFTQYFFIVSLLQQVMPNFRGFILDGNDLKWQSEKQVLDFSVLPDNFVRFFGLALLFIQPEENFPSLLALDNADLGLDSKMLELLAYMIKTCSSQVIVTTNSSKFLDYFSIDDVVYFSYNKTPKRVNNVKILRWLDNYSLGELYDMDIFETLL